MKKFCMCIVTLVVILFVGFSTYYIIRNDENISYTVGDNETIYMNVGETIASPIIHTHKASGSKVAVTLSNNNVVYNEKDNTFFAAAAGSATITAVPSNSDFAAISFTITVGNGSSLNPFYIRAEQDFSSIGSEKFPLTAAYELVNDISFTQDFTPIGSEREPFSGMLFGGEMMYKISNINIVSESNLAGVFAATSSSAIIERVTFENVTINGEYDYAGAVAAINNGFVGQCVVSADLKNNLTKGLTGGIVGKNGPNARISICTSDVSFQTKNFAGGIVGKSEGGIVDNCKATSTANNQGALSVFGGIVGQNTFGKAKIANDEKIFNSKYVNDLSIITNIGTNGNYYAVAGKSMASSANLATWTYFDMLFSRSVANLDPIGNLQSDNILVEGGTEAINFFHNLSLTESEDEDVYTNPKNSTWDFEQIWKLEDGKLFIDYSACAGSYQELPWNSSSKMEIATLQDALNALDLIRRFPQAGFEYTITEDIDIDFEGQTISPIGNENSPFIGKIVGQKYEVKQKDPETDEETIETYFHQLSISNFVIDSQEKYAGFFGAVSGADTRICGLYFENCQINGRIIGTVAGFNNGATIQDCSTSNCILNTREIAGGIVGINKGNIISTQADTDTTSQTTLNLSNNITAEVSIGGIAGQNSGKVTGVELNQCHINLIKQTDKTINMGGVVGLQVDGKIENCGSFNADLNGVGFTSLGHIYSGGIAGSLQGGEIVKCFVTSFGSTLDQNSQFVAGGIAGFVGSKATVLNSLFHSGSVKASRAGGIAGELHGAVENCACEITAIVSGDVVAGLVADCFGTLTNCYSLASLQGSSIQAGFVATLNNGSNVQFNYNYCAYNGSGAGYCETSTAFRSKNGDWKFVNNIVVGNKVFENKLYGFLNSYTKCTQRDGKTELKIQNKNQNKGSFVLFTLDDAKKFINYHEKGFNSEIWDIYGDSEFLTLRVIPIISDGLSE